MTTAMARLFIRENARRTARKSDGAVIDMTMLLAAFIGLSLSAMTVINTGFDAQTDDVQPMLPAQSAGS